MSLERHRNTFSHSPGLGRQSWSGKTVLVLRDTYHLHLTEPAVVFVVDEEPVLLLVLQQCHGRSRPRKVCKTQGQPPPHAPLMASTHSQHLVATSLTFSQWGGSRCLVRLWTYVGLLTPTRLSIKRPLSRFCCRTERLKTVDPTDHRSGVPGASSRSVTSLWFCPKSQANPWGQSESGLLGLKRPCRRLTSRIGPMVTGCQRQRLAAIA